MRVNAIAGLEPRASRFPLYASWSLDLKGKPLSHHHCKSFDLVQRSKNMSLPKKENHSSLKGPNGSVERPNEHSGKVSVNPVRFCKDVLVKGSILHRASRHPRLCPPTPQPAQIAHSPCVATRSIRGACKGWTDISFFSFFFATLQIDCPAPRSTVEQ